MLFFFSSWCRDLSPLAESPVQPGSNRQLNQHEPAASDPSASEYPGRVRGSAHAACCYLDAAEIWVWINTYYSNTIFRGMNIHLPAILMFTRGTRFWHTAIWSGTTVRSQHGFFCRLHPLVAAIIILPNHLEGKSQFRTPPYDMATWQVWGCINPLTMHFGEY